MNHPSLTTQPSAGDLYPDTVSAVPATTAKEWMSGRNVQPNMMSMQAGHAAANASTMHSVATAAATQKKLNGGPAPAATVPNDRNDSNRLLTNGNANAATKLIMTNGGADKDTKHQHQQTLNNNNSECNKENDNKYDNNSKKFAFLAQQTIPDYRSQAVSYSTWSDGRFSIIIGLVISAATDGQMPEDVQQSEHEIPPAAGDLRPPGRQQQGHRQSAE